MPGPVALKVRQFYGFPGNHFWKIMTDLFGRPRDISYAERIAMLKANGVALWDVFESCEREGALDADIKCVTLNDIPGLVKKHSTIKAVFLNGSTSYNTYQKHFHDKVKLPAFRMPSTSPAHAAMNYEAKKKVWSTILKHLK
jgi:hypoxanthine-DNA glycosylase